MENKIKPVANKVIVKPEKQEEVSKGGIFIPEKSRQAVNTGVVIALGDQEDHPFEVSVGDEVIYRMGAGTETKLDNEYYLTMREEDILVCKSKSNE